jgi:hypothetical protein
MKNLVAELENNENIGSDKGTKQAVRKETLMKLHNNFN